MKRNDEGIDRYIGRRLREIRLARGDTQEGFAELLGVSQGQLCKLENGERTLPVSLVFALAQRLQIPVASLFPPQCSGDVVDDEAELIEAWRQFDHLRLLQLLTRHLEEDAGRSSRGSRLKRRNAKSE
jgi:transcriptional regulator with XRE-family HTH domain